MDAFRLLDLVVAIRILERQGDVIAAKLPPSLTSAAERASDALVRWLVDARCRAPDDQKPFDLGTFAGVALDLDLLLTTTALDEPAAEAARDLRTALLGRMEAHPGGSVAVALLKRMPAGIEIETRARVMQETDLSRAARLHRPQRDPEDVAPQSGGSTLARPILPGVSGGRYPGPGADRYQSTPVLAAEAPTLPPVEPPAPPAAEPPAPPPPAATTAPAAATAPEEAAPVLANDTFRFGAGQEGPQFLRAPARAAGVKAGAA